MFKYLLIVALIGLVAAVDSNEKAEELLRSDDVRPDGFETKLKISNGIEQEQSGDVHGNSKGSFSWISDDGVHVEVKYVADENGYQPSSDLLPTSPPIPDEIKRSLEWIAAHPNKELSKYD
ncbi:larval cuticle protein III/IV-like [Drosophila hydei]|uniref:Larval cuticle protein III/IV-like n=1 Tax=Drosophila hydei TaxID=7224 RepID=A0A6J1LIV0_DROHY|nr:larval cuticle protein III/IV-like [Drosophila hydei]